MDSANCTTEVWTVSIVLDDTLADEATFQLDLTSNFELIQLDITIAGFLLDLDLDLDLHLELDTVDHFYPVTHSSPRNSGNSTASAILVEDSQDGTCSSPSMKRRRLF